MRSITDPSAHTYHGVVDTVSIAPIIFLTASIICQKENEVIIRGQIAAMMMNAIPLRKQTMHQVCFWLCLVTCHRSPLRRSSSSMWMSNKWQQGQI